MSSSSSSSSSEKKVVKIPINSSSSSGSSSSSSSNSSSKNNSNSNIDRKSLVKTDSLQLVQNKKISPTKTTAAAKATSTDKKSSSNTPSKASTKTLVIEKSSDKNNSNSSNNNSNTNNNSEKQKAITSFFTKKPENKNDASNNDVRRQSHASSKTLFANVKNNLPATFDNVKVLNFGTVIVGSSFHSSVQIYPVDYKCEITINTYIYTCEISNRNEKPYFSILKNDSNDVYNGSTESEVWENLTLIEENVVNPSFFNLKIELLIEGMDNAIDCKSYKFHKERGYETIYRTDAESYEAKLKFLGKELSKSIRFNSMLKQPQPSKKEEEKRKKEAEKQKKEAEKEKKNKEREALKSETKEQKEKRMQEQKVKTVFRREITTNLKKVRQEVASLVTKEFDNEQDAYAQNKLDGEFKLKSADHDALRTYFDSLPHCHQFFDVVESDWADVLKVANTLQILQDHMDFPISSDLPQLIDSLKKISSSSSQAVAKVEKANAKVTDTDMAVDDGVNNEDEWDGSYTKSNANEDVKEMTNDCSEDARAQLDRIYLHIAKLLSTNLGPALDFIDDGTALALPINQLTWIELARMSMLLHIVIESGENKDDYPFLIRGGKQMNFRSNKNICRAVRYRFTVRLKHGNVADADKKTDTITFGDCNSENKLLSMSMANVEQVKLVDNIDPISTADKYKNNESLQNEFNDDEEQLSSRIMSMSSDENESDTYRRCCKVFLKILEMSASKHLLWEYGGGGGEENDYYEIIKNPMAFCDVATNILVKKYGSDEKEIITCFYRDMLQVPINCITYNSELLIVVAQAQKLIQAIHRHMDRWLLNSNLPIESCDNQHCLLSGNIIASGAANAGHNNVKCGRCSGIFCLNTLDQFTGDVARNPTFCLPTHDVISIASEEWVCLFCLKEDSSKLQRSTRQNIFYIDEWGPSTFLPWLLNKKYTNLENIKEGTIESTIIDGLKIMVDSTSWTFADHIKVLLALCDTLKLSQKCIDKMISVQSKFDGITKYIEKNLLREAEFTQMIKEACGYNAFKYCRDIIRDKIHDDKVDDVDDFSLFLNQGRCSICHKETHNDDDQTQILLCDACNCDTHMECAGLSSAPKKGFYCEPCSLLAEDVIKFDIENYRDTDIEHQLQERVLENKLASEDHDNDADDNNLPATPEMKVQKATANEPKGQLCAYCKLSELEVCSPFVIGQSREEHDAYIAMQSTSNPDIPYFPLADGTDSGAKIINEYKNLGRKLVIVHELCALNMFQARINLNMYKKRKQWSKAADKAIDLSGIHIQSLGKDDDGREYWKFPNCDYIFICCPNSKSSPAANWKIVTTTQQVQSIIDKLGCSLVENKVTQNLVDFIKDRNNILSATAANALVVNSTESNEVVMENDDDDDDNNPVELKLIVDKGQPINKTYSVPDESAFMDDIDSMDNDEVYASFEKKIYFAIGLVNKNGRVLKVPKGLVTVRFLIHKDDGKITVSDAQLDESWHTDHLYYFTVPIFKRAGNYTAEGFDVADVKPLVYRLQAVPKKIRTGMNDAIEKLNANQFLNSSQRQFKLTSDVREQLNTIDTELDAVKCALMSVYCALPLGSVVVQPQDEVGVYDVYECITEATGWNDYLDQAWKGMVQNATGPVALMECTIVLEHFINKEWLKSPQNRLLNALPNFHFALRCASLSSIALRIYSLDQAMDYKKQKGSGRESRTLGRSQLETVQTKPKKVSPPQKASKKDLDNFIDDEDEEEYTMGGRQRSKRAASNAASSKLKKTNYYEDDDEEVDDFDNYGDGGDEEEDDDEEGGRRSKRSKNKRSNDFIDDDDDDDDGFKRRSSRKKTKVNYNVDDAGGGDEEVADQIVYDDIDFEEEINKVQADDELDDDVKTVILKCMELLSILHDDKDTNIFWIPVDTNVIGDYLSIVPEPMDLGTITRNLRLGVYGTDYEAFVNDVRKVWNNCTTYNFRGSGLAILGSKMKTKWENMVAEHIPR